MSVLVGDYVDDTFMTTVNLTRRSQAIVELLRGIDASDAIMKTAADTISNTMVSAGCDEEIT